MSEPTPENAKRYQEKCMPLFGKVGYQKSQTDRCIKNPEIFAHYCQNDLKQLDYLNDLHKIHCPTLFMVGELSPGHPPVLAAEMAAHVDPKCVTYHEFKDAGAPVYNDSPDEAYNVVSDFLASL
jgi:pimeloyl-ACP methyl ester carboxylesterase